jgi:hypothetical protein
MAIPDFKAMGRAVHNLKRGTKYRVSRSFIDANGKTFDVGRELTYCRWRYFPKHEEYTLEFEGAEILLSEIEHEDILTSLNEYLCPTAT